MLVGVSVMAMVDKKKKVSECSRGYEDLGSVVAATDTNDDQAMVVEKMKVSEWIFHKFEA